jgi:hypothetical protein
MHTDDALPAFTAACQALAAAGVRQLAAIAFEDQEVGSLAVEIDRDGSMTLTLCNTSGMPIGGYSL